MKKRSFLFFIVVYLLNSQFNDGLCQSSSRAVKDTNPSGIPVLQGVTGFGLDTGGGRGIATEGAYNVIIDHCSTSWSTDENLSASGPRFNGKTPDEWDMITLTKK